MSHYVHKCPSPSRCPAIQGRLCVSYSLRSQAAAAATLFYDLAGGVIMGWWLKAFTKLNKMPNHKR